MPIVGVKRRPDVDPNVENECMIALDKLVLDAFESDLI
jgi:hypothetical protein